MSETYDIRPLSNQTSSINPGEHCGALEAGLTQSGSLTSFSTGELGSTDAGQNNVWTKTVTTHRN